MIKHLKQMVGAEGRGESKGSDREKISTKMSEKRHIKTYYFMSSVVCVCVCMCRHTHVKEFLIELSHTRDNIPLRS